MLGVDMFIDTNILIYAHDLDAGEKYDKASQLIRGLWDRREVPFLSIQVLQEICTVQRVILDRMVDGD